MINYNNGKIYKIEPNVEHEENEIYILVQLQKNICVKGWQLIAMNIKIGKKIKGIIIHVLSFLISMDLIIVQ